MGQSLVVVESPAKAKTINKILGKDYIVMSSMGHVRDLPLKKLGVDIKDSFKPQYVNVPGRKKIISELKKAADKCDVIYLAPDPDREGEAIAWHLKELLKGSKSKPEFIRIQYNEITPRAVKHAFENPTTIALDRVDAQQARRILDRIVGYKVSPMLWKRMRRGLSAGRVQSVALRLVCEREAQIVSFVPEKFWIMGVLAAKLVEPVDPFSLRLTRIAGKKASITSLDQAKKIKTDLSSRQLVVSKITVKDVKKNAKPPYITSTLQQSASSYCGFSPKRTMGIAQKLYEGVDLGGERVGLITYMRTDSFTIAQDALASCRDFIKGTYGDEYCPDSANHFKNKGNAQEAHEAIRPTDVTRTPESLSSKLEPVELKLYKLIWKRFVASQMTPAEITQRTIKVSALTDEAKGSADDYTFQASISDVKFPGYMKVTKFDLKKKNDEEIDFLPEVSEGEVLKCVEWLSEEKETQPPHRFTEASLIKELESNGVGRPSTYAQTISTLQNRKYVESIKRTLHPTTLGMDVTTLLVKVLGDLFDVGFTASMEEKLDNIEQGKVQWTEMLATFYDRFDKWMENTKLPPADKGAVEKILETLTSVKTWAPEVQKGKRKYSDKKFVDSIADQLKKGEKDVSQRQLDALLRIAWRYKDQNSAIPDVIESLGRSDIFKDPNMQPPKDSTTKKLELLKDIDMDDSARSFAESLKIRTDSGRCLSAAQINALNNIVMSHSAKIKGFDEIKGDLDIENSEVAEDNESKVFISVMSQIKDWHEPVTRGKRVFDDKNFYISLKDHFDRKGFLSVRQRAALKRMVSRYKDQVPEYDKLKEEFHLGSKSSKTTA